MTQMIFNSILSTISATKPNEWSIIREIHFLLYCWILSPSTFYPFRRCKSHRCLRSQHHLSHWVVGAFGDITKGWIKYQVFLFFFFLDQAVSDGVLSFPKSSLVDPKNRPLFENIAEVNFGMNTEPNLKLSTFTGAELALIADWKHFLPLLLGVKVSTEPLHQDTVVNVSWPALLFRRRTAGRHFKRTLTINPPPPQQRPPQDLYCHPSKVTLLTWKQPICLASLFFLLLWDCFFLLSLLCISGGLRVSELRATFMCCCHMF